MLEAFGWIMGNHERVSVCACSQVVQVLIVCRLRHSSCISGASMLRALAGLEFSHASWAV